MSALIYNLYSTNEVFRLPLANVVCNQMMQALTDQSFVNLNSHFALTGDAAYCYDNTSDGPIENIQFATDEPDIFIWLAGNLKKSCGSITAMEKYEKRLIAYFEGAVLEIYLYNSITTRNVGGIYITDSI